MKEWWSERSILAKSAIILAAVVVLSVAVAGGDDENGRQDATDEQERLAATDTTNIPPSSETPGPSAISTTTTSEVTTTSSTSPTTTASSTTTTTTTTTVPTTTTTTDPMAELAFEPFEASGSGDDVVDFAVPQDLPAAVELTHSGSSNFAVISHTADNERIDLLVNTVGPYEGVRPVNLYQGENVGFLEITADGPWSLAAIPVPDLAEFGTSASGRGDAVLLVTNAGGRLSLTHDGESNFAVLSHGASRDLLVNEIGSYDGTVLLDGGALLLEINADGSWTLEMD